MEDVQKIAMFKFSTWQHHTLSTSMKSAFQGSYEFEYEQEL